MTYSHKYYLPVTKNKDKKILNCNLCSTKNTYFAIFGQLWMVVYTAIMKTFEIFPLYMMRIGVTEKVKNFEIDPIFAEKVIQKKLMEGGNFTPPPLRGIGLSTRYLF